MSNYVNAVNMYVSMFCHALVDTVSFHRAAKFIVNSSAVRQEIGMTLMANGFLLLGSVLLYRYFIEPVSQLMRGSDEDSSSLANISVWSFYHLLWMVPIWGLCYVVSLGCYQSIADEVHGLQLRERRQGKRSEGGVTTGPVDVKRTISGTVYAAIVWLLMFLQIRVFDIALPALLNQAARVVFAALDALTLPPTALRLSLILFVQPLTLVAQGSRLFGFILGAIVYGWYGFDMDWIARGHDPEQRFRAVEEHWVYFCGFGLPYALLLRSTSFFLGYGLYLMLFPFTLMLGAVCDWERVPPGPEGVQMAFRVFGPSQRLALRVIKAVDRYLRPSASRKKKSR
mmetsp:Transcript_7124/g.11947  ORF Transcript_7124/g.11947 Transcript_7124/m.11947 type:complete len:341 (-) Transcript_7124:2718-3740(-)